MKKFNNQKLNEENIKIHLYNKEILAFANSHGNGKRLTKYHTSVQKIGRLCGSRIIIDILWQKNLKYKKIAELGYHIDACALGIASAAIFNDAAKNSSENEINYIYAQIKNMLKGNDFCYKEMEGWQKLSLLQAASLYRARHDAILLPAEAILQAFTDD